MDADDVVQDAYLRWSAVPADEVDEPAAYLTTITTRLAIDRLRSAQRKRETYVGTWLPEPVYAEADPAHSIEIAESTTIGFLAVLERLNPVERAVFLLHDVFHYPFDEVAAIVGRTSVNCRQIAKRARERVHSERPRYQTEAAHEAELVQAFMGAAMNGEIDALHGLLSEDAISYSDGGAEQRAARRPVVGPDRIARLFVNLAARAPAGTELHPANANGQPAVYAVQGEDPIVLLIFGIADDAIHRIYAVVNRDKLRAFHSVWRAERS